MNETHKRHVTNPNAFLIRHKLIKITPSYHGQDCLAFVPNERCGCDECEHFLECFPEGEEGTKLKLEIICGGKTDQKSTHKKP